MVESTERREAGAEILDRETVTVTLRTTAPSSLNPPSRCESRTEISRSAATTAEPLGITSTQNSSPQAKVLPENKMLVLLRNRVISKKLTIPPLLSIPLSTMEKVKFTADANEWN
jgi:hypothetical protein